MSNPANFTPHAARALGVVVRIEGIGEPVPLHVVGWAPVEGGSWEAVVAMPDTSARRASELVGECGVLEVLGIGPVQEAPPQPVGTIHLPGGMPLPAGLAR